ncbi:ribonuclease P protein component [Bacteroidales bacterium OttesenSCG-928-L03]|nr:ribonuclease P protein component [Bacteroidales bacterium OttesenSCG-928-L03]
MQTNTFHKSERISSQRDIDSLFTGGLSFISYPLRVVYVEKKETETTKPSASILISVPKKKFKRAVKRNRVKRLVRESYRLNKHSFLDFLQENNKTLLVAFLFVGDDLPDYKTVEAAVIKALGKLQEKLA